MKHAKFSPSTLTRIINCPGSVGLTDNLKTSNKIPSEEKSSSYADHGTALHDVTHKCFTRGTQPLVGLEVEDRFLVQECLDYLDMLRKSKGHSYVAERSEVRAGLDKWGIPDVWGTTDHYVMDLVAKHIDVIDWKFGSGIMVYAKENPQLLAYAAGVIGWPTDMRSVTVHVVQPAKEHIDTWTLSIDELYDWVHGTLAIAISRASRDDAEFNAGVDQCRWCPAQNHCRERHDEIMDRAARLFHASESLALTPDIDELVQCMELAPLVEKSIKAIREYLQKELEHGRHVPNYKLVSGRSNRSWKDEKETIKWLAANTTIEEFYTSKIRSPNQLEMEAKNLKQMDEFKALYEQKPGKTTMATLNDKRDAINVESAIDVFSKVGSDPELSEIS